MNGIGQSAAGCAAQMPREQGVLARIDGVAVGLKELHHKLLAFGGRLSGNTSADRDEGGYPPGISPALAASEMRLRECHEIVDALHKAF